MHTELSFQNVEQKRPLWTDTNSSEDNIKPGFKKLVERLSG